VAVELVETMIPLLELMLLLTQVEAAAEEAVLMQMVVMVDQASLLYDIAQYRR
jgi:hypothetical protein